MVSEITDDGSRFEAAAYRVRLFLSVDLSGSTAFKNSKIGEDRQEMASPKWVTVFQRFYTGFPSSYQTIYQRQTNSAVGANGCPTIWKAIGDELVFCGLVSNKKAVAVALMAFIEAMHEYRKDLSEQGLELNLKGAAWLAAFPEPNRAVQLQRHPDQPELYSASEALENAADKRPFDFDFLGKGIDTGFRVASTAKPERFALSVQLARLLVSGPPGLGFDHEIHFSEPTELKGVNRGEPYPRLYIDTMKHLPAESLRKQERTLLGQKDVPTRDALASYLSEYCSVVGTDEILLSTDSHDRTPVAEPASYSEHKHLIAEHFRQEKGREFGLTELLEPPASDELDILTETEALNPLSQDNK